MTISSPMPDLNAGTEQLPRQQQAGSFLKSLLDTSFSTFIVPRLIRFLYMLCMAVGALIALAAVVAAFNINSALGVLALLLSPVVFFLVLIQARVTLESSPLCFRSSTTPPACDRSG